MPRRTLRAPAPAASTLLCRHLTGHTTGGVWLSFFLVQVPLIVFERLVLAALKRRGVILPDWLRALVGVRLTPRGLDTAGGVGCSTRREPMPAVLPG